MELSSGVKKEIVVAGAVIVLVVGAVFGNSYINEREARATFQAKAEVLENSVAELKKSIDATRADADRKIGDLERIKTQVASAPQYAPQVIKEYVPFSQPLNQTAQITKDTAPDAPVATITKQQEIELAQFAISCRQCKTDNDALKSESKDKDAIIKAKDAEIVAAKIAIKGGTKWQRTKKTLKYVGIGAIIGYAVAHSKK